MADNLDLPQVMANQDQKEVTINDAFAQLSGALDDFIDISMSGGDVTLTTAQFTFAMGFVTSGASSLHTLTVPAIKRALFYVENSNTAALTVKVGTTSFVIDIGVIAFFQTDGTANGLAPVVPAGPQGTVEQDIIIAFPGTPPAGVLAAEAIWIPFNQSVTLPASLTGSHFTIGTNPAATWTASLYKNGSSIGTVSFSTGGSPSVSFASAVSFAIGDILQIVPPNPQDASAANVSMNFRVLKN